MLIKLETALLAKEKGFKMNSCTFYQFSPKGEKRYELVGYEDDSDYDSYVSEDAENRIAVCEQFYLQKWLREDKNLATRPVHRAQISGEPIDFWFLYNYGVGTSTTTMYKTYEEALEASLQEGLRLI